MPAILYVFVFFPLTLTSLSEKNIHCCYECENFISCVGLEIVAVISGQRLLSQSYAFWNNSTLGT